MAALFHILSPLILHLVVSEAVAWLLAGRIPDTGIVLISSVLILPAAAWMAMKERNSEQVRLSGHWKKAAACALSAAGGALLNAAVSSLIRRTSLPERFPDTVQKSLLSQNRILVLITLVIVVPVTEIIAMVNDLTRSALSVRWTRYQRACGLRRRSAR